jgi:hypothetical protein
VKVVGVFVRFRAPFIGVVVERNCASAPKRTKEALSDLK